jgi:hypothetical protein
MINQGPGLRPLCPKHNEVMVVCPLIPDQSRVAADATEIHDCECLVDGCSQHNSPGYGYFTVLRNDDHWVATGSSSLRIIRNPVQVICAEHRQSIFIESRNSERQIENYRCPQDGCHHTMSISGGGPPAYWLGEGYFGGP